MNTFKVTFEDGNEIITGFNGTLEEAGRYYLNNRFNFGDTDAHPADLMLRAISVDDLRRPFDPADKKGE